MNWIANFVRPKIKNWISRRKSETPENLWTKCPGCGEMIFHRDLVAAQFVCPQCGFHLRVGPKERFAWTFDAGSYDELPVPPVAADPLKFRDEKRYTDRLKDARAKTGRQEALVAARGTLDGTPVMIAVQPFDFMGGSLGMGLGEALVQAMQAAVERTPRVHSLCVFRRRAHAGRHSFADADAARDDHAWICSMKRGLPYIVVLTDPTTGGVSASYAMLGDIQIAEPGALIGFAGQRVIEQTIREKLPEGFQRAEYLRDHGMIDMVVHRHEMRATLSRLVHMMMKKPRPKSRTPALTVIGHARCRVRA